LKSIFFNLLRERYALDHTINRSLRAVWIRLFDSSVKGFETAFEVAAKVIEFLLGIVVFVCCFSSF